MRKCVESLNGYEFCMILYGVETSNTAQGTKATDMGVHERVLDNQRVDFP